MLFVLYRNTKIRRFVSKSIVTIQDYIQAHINAYVKSMIKDVQTRESMFLTAVHDVWFDMVNWSMVRRKFILYRWKLLFVTDFQVVCLDGSLWYFRLIGIPMTYLQIWFLRKDGQANVAIWYLYWLNVRAEAYLSGMNLNEDEGGFTSI